MAGCFWLLAFLLSYSVIAQETVSLSGANSTQNDINPVWVGNNTLLFTRAFHIENLGGNTDPGDIWMVQKTGENEWSEAIHRADLSTSGFDVALGLQNVLTLLVFHEDQEGNAGIHEYAKFGKDWNYRRRIEVPQINDFTGVVSGNVVDGKYIFLSGNGPNSLGNEDLYVFELVSGITWSEPQNLGTVINTFGQEVSPFYDSEDQLLYYSTNNQSGAQGKDIYITKKMGDTWQDWSNPVNWEKLNSPGSEMAVAFVGSNQVVWSSSQNSNGFSDLLTFAQEEELELPTGFTPALRRSISRNVNAPAIEQSDEVYLTEEKIKPISPLIAVGKPEVGLFIDSVKLEQKPLEWIAVDATEKVKLDFDLEFLSKKNPVTFTGKDTLFLSDLIKKGVDEVKVLSDGYFPQIIPVTGLDQEQPNMALLVKVSKGSSIKLEKVSFQRGTSEFEGVETELALKEISTFLLENEEVVVRIHGHTDSSGDPSLNKALSLDRAKAVRDYMVSLGVPFERMRISGWGGTRPLASNATEAGRQKNRRVELEVQ